MPRKSGTQRSNLTFLWGEKASRWGVVLLFLGALSWAWVGCGESQKEDVSTSKKTDPWGTSEKSLLDVSGRLVGELVVDVADDFANHRTWYNYFVRSYDTGEHIALSLQQKADLVSPLGRRIPLSSFRDHGLLTGMMVSVEGSLGPAPSEKFLPRVFSTKTILLSTKKTPLHTLPPPSLTPSTMLLKPFSAWFAPTPMPILQVNNAAPIKRKMAILIVNLTDKAAFMTSSTSIESLLDKNNDVYDKATFGLVQFLSDLNNDGKADIYGPFTINDTSASICASKYSSWGSEARNLASAQGIDLSAYNHMMHIVPNLSNCKWAGVANLGGQHFYIRTGGGDARVISHELGHNLGVRHAAKDPNNDGAHNSGSTSEEYGDYSCFMGIQLRNLNAPHMIQMGVWDRYPQQVVAGKTGTYKIYPLLGDPTKAAGPQVLYLPRADKNRFYYLSFKTSLHYDKSMNASYKTGVSIHTHTPPANTSPPVSYHVKTLVDGETFSDTPNGLTIKQIKKDAADAFVEVQIGLTPPAVDPKCQRAQPTITATSPVLAGLNKPAYLYFSLKNNDNADCPSTLFNMSAKLEGGYQLVNVGNSVRTQVFFQNFVAPQATASFRLYVLNDGVSRDVTATFTDEYQGSHQPVVTKVRVDVDANPPTTPLSLAAQVLSPTQVKLTWKASTDQGSGLLYYRLYRALDGTGVFNRVFTVSSNQVTYTDTTIPAGTKSATYYVIALDKAQNESPQSNKVTVNLLTSEPSSEPNAEGKVEPRTETSIPEELSQAEPSKEGGSPELIEPSSDGGSEPDGLPPPDEDEPDGFPPPDEDEPDGLPPPDEELDGGPSVEGTLEKNISEATQDKSLSEGTASVEPSSNESVPERVVVDKSSLEKSPADGVSDVDASLKPKGGGCSCHATPQEQVPSQAVFFLSLLLLFLRRRRLPPL